jgi:hypothetical protein
MLELLTIVIVAYLIIGILVTAYSHLENGDSFMEAVTSGLLWIVWLVWGVLRESVRRFKQE